MDRVTRRLARGLVFAAVCGSGLSAFPFPGPPAWAQGSDRDGWGSVTAARGASGSPQPWVTSEAAQKPSAGRARGISQAAARMNRPSGIAARNAVAPVGPQGAESFPIEARVAAPETFHFTAEDLTDLETNNATSTIGSTSVALSESRVLLAGNRFVAASVDGGSTWFYASPDSLPPIPGQSFCCNSSVIYDRSRELFIWISLATNAAQTESTLRIVPLSSEFTGGYLYHFTSASFGKAGLLDFPQAALGANYLYITVNHFNPGFTGSTVFRLPLTEMRAFRNFAYDYVNRNEFGLRLAQDSGPGTTAYFATHVNNTTLRVFRWEEASATIQTRDVTIPAWTRGSLGDFVCTAPDGNNPCSRMDDRVLAGFVMGGGNLPVTSAQKVVGFSWNARQGSGFTYPYTNLVRIDAESLALIDNPSIWSSTSAFVYADFHPNDRGDLGGVLNQIGPGNHPALVATVLDRDWGTPPAWPLYTLRTSNDSPDSDTWGDFNTVRRSHLNGYQWIAGGHTMQGGGGDGSVVPVFVKFWKGRDGF